MQAKDYINIASAIIGSIGTSSIIIVGLSSWLGKVWASRILEIDKLKYSTELEKTKSSYEKELEKYRQELEKAKHKSILYSEFQFKLYNEVWRTLCKLKYLANDLWEEASFVNLRSFMMHLEKTIQVVDTHQLLIEDRHLVKLLQTLDSFTKFKLGKQDLITLKNWPKERENQVDEGIKSVIISNTKYHESYVKLLKEISTDLKNQIRGK